MRALRRATRLLLLSLATAVGAAVLWIHSADFERRARVMVETTIEELTGEECTISHTRVRLWPPRIEVDGLHLFERDGGESLLQVERIRVPLVLRDGGPRIGRLRLQAPVVQLQFNEDGSLRSLPDLNLGPKDPSMRRPLTELPWRSVQIQGGAIRLLTPHGHLRIEDLELLPVDADHGRLTARVEVAHDDFLEETELDLPRVKLGGRQLSIPQLRLDSRPLTLTGRAAWPLGGELDLDLSARVHLGTLNPLLPEPRAIEGTIDADLRLEGPPDHPTARISAAAQELKLEVPGVFTPVLHYNVGAVAAAVVADRDEVRIERATLFTPDGGHLTAQGRITLDDRILQEAHIIGEGVSLAHLLWAFDAAPTPWVEMSADAEIWAKGPLQPLDLEGTFDLSVADLRVGDRPIADPQAELMLDIPNGWARGTLSLNPDRIRLSAPEVHGPRSRGSAIIDIGFGPRGPLNLQANLSHADLSDFQPLNGVQLSGVGRIAGRIAGPFNALSIEAEGDVHDLSVLEIPWADQLQAEIRSPDMKRLQLHNARARRGQTRYAGHFEMDFRSPLRMDTDIRIGSGRVEDLVGAFIDLPGLKGELHTGTLRLTGPLADLDGEAHFSLGRSDLWGERFEHGSAHGFMDQGLFTLNDLRVLRHGDTEGLMLRGRVKRDWALDMELLSDGLGLERLDSLEPAEQPLVGHLAAYSRIQGTLFEPEPAGRITLTDARYAGNAVEDSLITFETTDGVLSWEGNLLGAAARAAGTLGLWGTQPYEVRAALDRVPAHLLYPFGADGRPILAEVSGSLSLHGHFGETWSPVSLAMHLPEVHVQYGPHDLRNDGPWSYIQEGDRFRLQGFNLQGGDTRLRLHAQGGEALLLGGEGRVDLDLLRAVVPGLQRAVGTGELVMYAVGSRPEVEAVVEVEIDADLVRHDAIPASFEDLSGRVRLTDERFTLEGVTAALGGGTVDVTGGVEAEGWLPTRYDLRIDVRDAQVQWVDTLPPAIGDARLRFDGPVEALLLHGRVDVREMTFADRIDWEDWVVEYREQMQVDRAADFDAEAWFSLDVELDAPRTIELRNNVAEATATAELRIIGDTARPGLIGTVRVDDGIAFLQDRHFRIERGNLLFNDPWTWDPELDFQLITDIDNRRQLYRVNYMVMGPFSDWRTTSRSDPPLPQADVNALLWFGLTTDQLEEMGGLSTAVAQGVANLILSDFLISNQAGEFAEELPEFLFDRIDFATGVNGRGEYSAEPRLLVEKRLDTLGNMDIRWEFNLVRPEDNYVRAQKRISSIWSLSGWYASQQRDRVLPIGGAYGVDVTARWEIE